MKISKQNILFSISFIFFMITSVSWTNKLDNGQVSMNQFSFICFAISFLIILYFIYRSFK